MPAHFRTRTRRGLRPPGLRTHPSETSHARRGWSLSESQLSEGVADTVQRFAVAGVAELVAQEHRPPAVGGGDDVPVPVKPYCTQTSSSVAVPGAGCQNRPRAGWSSPVPTVRERATHSRPKPARDMGGGRPEHVSKAVASSRGRRPSSRARIAAAAAFPASRSISSGASPSSRTKNRREVRVPFQPRCRPASLAARRTSLCSPISARSSAPRTSCRSSPGMPAPKRPVSATQAAPPASRIGAGSARPCRAS